MRVLINWFVWHLDVDSAHPGGAQSTKGPAVRRLKRRETVWSLSTVLKENNYKFTSVREDQEELTASY